MSTRKIIDAKQNGEKVWLKGHAKAIYMSDGSTVEDAINNIQDSGGIATETDPIFSVSPAAKITDVNITSWNNKVDKIDGKQLSTEDFTTVLKLKLDGLSNYNDTEISQAVSNLRTDLDTLVSGDTTTAIKTFNEVIAFLDGISDTEDLASIIASIEQQIAAKGTYTKPSNGIPKSDLTSAVQTSLGKADTALQSVPSEYVTETELNNKGYATSSQLNAGFTDAERKFAALNEEMDYKQTKLVSGTNIKTINGESILGEGNLTVNTEANIQAIDTTDEIEDVETNTYVKYVALTLTDELKALVRENIGALSASDLVTVDLSNYYTKEEINALLGDINSILEDIINGSKEVIYMITFAVKGTEYRAEEGMTWGEWINSEYNTDGYHTEGGTIFNSNNNVIGYTSNAQIGALSIIEPGHYYTYYVPSGGSD